VAVIVIVRGLGLGPLKRQIKIIDLVLGAFWTIVRLVIRFKWCYATYSASSSVADETLTPIFRLYFNLNNVYI